MLRAQHDVNAADAEVATLQKSVDYWKEVRTALGGKDVLMDKQGNPITADGKLVVEEINSIDDISDDDFNVPTRNIQLPILPLHIDKAIGANGKPVVIKKNIFNKNRKNHKDLGASDSRYILNNVFYNTNMYGQNQKVSRPYNWILIHTADKNSAVIVEVNEGKDNVEVVGWQYLRGNSLEQKKRQAIKEGGLILTLENAAGNTLNGSSSASKDNVGLSDMQEKVEESLPPLDKKIQRRINAAQTREKNRLSVPKEWSELTKAKKEYASYPEIIEVLNMSEPSDGFELAAEWLSHSKITPESFKHETGYGLSEQRQFVGMIARAENGGVSIERAAELLMDSDDNNYYGGDDYNARHAIITVLGEVNSRADLLHYIDNRRISEAERMYNHLLHEERSYLNEITMRDYDMSVDEYEADRELWNDYMDEVIEERLSGWENFRDSEAYFDLFDIFALESKTEENGREDTRNVMDGREKGLRDDIGNESSGVRESGSSLQGRGIGARTAIAEGNELRDSGGRPEGSGSFESSNPVEPSVSSGNVAFESGGEESRLSEKIASAESEVNTTPSEGQKKAGNYKKGHVQIGSFNVTIEQPKGSVRSGVDKDGKKWSTTMQNTYGYIRGTEGVDGDHIDVFLSDDIDGWDGRKVFVVDQYNPDGSFDEHKVMLGFNDIDVADAAYLSNYEEGWSDSRKIVIRPSTLEDFEKWINSSHRKTKPFAEYKSVQIAEQRRAEKEKSDVLYTVTPTQYTTKKGKELSMHLVTFGKELSKEQYKAAKEIAKSDKGWYDSKKGGFMMRSEASAKELAERVVSEGAAPIAEAQPSKVEDDKYKPVWEYHVSVDKETGRTTLSRDDVSGIIPIGDGRFKVYADSPEEMLDILRNPLNRMDEVLKEVEVTLENKITTRDLDRKIREEREQKRAELRKNGVNGYKIGEKVVYTPISSSRKAIEATIHDFEEYGTNKPVLDTGLGPVMYEVADWDRIKKSETVKENATGLQESDKNISFEGEKEPLKEIDNGRRIEKENSGLRKESGQEVERAERRGDVGGLHGNNVSDTSGGGRVSVGDGEQLTSVARVNNSRNYSFGENHLDLPTGEIGKLKGNIEAIPQIIEKSTYIESVENEDATKNRNVSRYHYYLCGLKIGGVDYTVKAVIAEQTNGNRYYDHKLTQIEKGKLLDSLSGITTPGFNQETSPVSGVKDKRLLSILQTNSSKVVDANGEPLVVYRGTRPDSTVHTTGKFRSNTLFATPNKTGASRYGVPIGLFMNIKNPAILDYEGAEYDEHIEDEFYTPGHRFTAIDRKAKTAVEKGYDGLIIKNVKDGTNYPIDDYVVLNPNQIKSATENNGEYSGENLDIRYSIRRKPVPKNVEKVYKLIRLGADKELYPLFIDAASPVKLGVWYDADSPNLEILKRMPEGVFLVDYENGTYESLSDYAQRTGEKVGKFPSVRSVNEATNAGLRWVEQEKVQDWLGIADLNRPIHTNNPELISIANVIECFENPNK